jgi:opacity protein-like surface antigen
LAVRIGLLVALLGALGAAAHAADLPNAAATPSLPTLALDPQAPPPSIWKGLYVGSEIFVSGVKGAKGFGGGAYAGYDRHFDNGLVLGVRASVGYAPFMFGPSPIKGFDYAMATAKVGYDMGRLTPYLLTGVAMTKANLNPAAGYFGPADSVNNVFNGWSNLATSGMIGAGFDYQITNNMSVGLAATVNPGNGGFVAPP